MFNLGVVTEIPAHLHGASVPLATRRRAGNHRTPFSPPDRTRSAPEAAAQGPCGPPRKQARTFGKARQAATDSAWRE